VRELGVVEVELVDAGLPLARTPIAHPNVGDLRQLREDYVAALLHLPQLTMLEQVFEPFVLLLQGHVVEGRRVEVALPELLLFFKVR